MSKSNKSKNPPKSKQKLIETKKKSKIKPKNSTDTKTNEQKVEDPLKLTQDPLDNKTTIQEIEPVIQKEPVLGQVTVIFNHYHDSFPIRDGVLDGNIVDDKYAFSFVNKGQYKLYLRDSDNKLMEKVGTTFINLIDQTKYTIEIEKDPEEIKRLASKPVQNIQFNKQSDLTPRNVKVNAITNELKKMTTEQLMDKGETYKELLEARDLEDILYS
ncbi:hypothetical protein HDV02_005867 [Globomyces sp. JEL0801]|nr:hypothetical protein HDV02_005867 [Globomyces sp. JEL0801]